MRQVKNRKKEIKKTIMRLGWFQNRWLFWALPLYLIILLFSFFAEEIIF